MKKEHLISENIISIKLSLSCSKLTLLQEFPRISTPLAASLMAFWTDYRISLSRCSFSLPKNKNYINNNKNHQINSNNSCANSLRYCSRISQLFAAIFSQAIYHNCISSSTKPKSQFTTFSSFLLVSFQIRCSAVFSWCLECNQQINLLSSSSQF